MSLHKFAEQVAAHGRGDDSLLVHMTPDEVQRLQKFAEANGRSLTINPTTGLPEAGFLSDLFKAVAPIALGAFLGPAGMGMSAAMAGVATGGITALATGSLSRGLMAGLGAYGGAGLGGSLMNAGTASIGSAAEGIQGPIGSPESGFGATQAIAAAPKADVLSAGFNAATASPTAAMDFAKANYKPLMAAASPILAASMVPTTTKLETPKSDNYIRQFDFNINPDTGKPDPLYGVRAMTPVKASEFGDKTLQGQRELFRQQNPNPYEMGVASLNQPPQPTKPMATGGIVALADGGIPGYADGMLVGDQDVFNYFKGLDQSKLGSGALDAQIAADMQKYNVSAADIARITGTGAQQGDYEKRFVQAIDRPDTSAAEFQAMTSDVGLQNQALANAMQNAGMSQAAQYASTHGLADTAPITGTNFYNQIGYKPGALPGDQGGLEGLYANINYAAQGLQNQIVAGNMTGQQAREAALNEMNRIGMSAADLKAATGKTLAELFPDTKVKPPPFPSVVPGGTKLDTATTYDNGAFGNYGSGPKTGVDYLGREVSVATPGDIITNPDQTRTVVPNIPGRPYGGFTGIDELKSKYTAGGGSLGYTAKAPRTMAEFDQLYNKQTGDSLAAYDYLMGKGSGKYPVKSGVSQVSVPYAEYVLGKKTTGLKPASATAKPVVGVPGQPQTYFNEAEYLAANPDVAAELKSGKAKFTNAYEHWLMYGKKEGRPFTGDYQGYTTAAALAGASQQGGESPSGPSGNTGNTISGFTPAPPDASIPESSMGIGPAADGSTGSTTGTEGGAVASARGGLLPKRYAQGGISGSGNLDLHIPLDFGGGSSGGGFGGGTPIPMSGTGPIGTTGGAMNPNTGTGGYGAAARPDESGGLYKGPMVMPAGLDDTLTPDIMAANTATQQKNAAAQAAARANPASLSALAKTLGIGMFANGGMTGYAVGGGLGSLGAYSDGGRLLKGPGDGVSDSIPATIGSKQQPARLADGEFVIPARIVSELGNGSTEAGAKKLYAMMDRVQKARGKTTGKNKVAANSRADKYLPA